MNDIKKQEQAGKHLTFRLQEEEYGIEILKVQEIMGMMPVTKVPRTPKFIRGVVNLRGKVIPVIDLRLKFNMEAIEDSEKTCIIVIQLETEMKKITMGMIVDEVSEVLDILSEQIEDAPSFGTQVNTDFILGMGKVNSKVIMLLDVNKVLTCEELDVVDQTSHAAQ